VVKRQIKFYTDKCDIMYFKGENLNFSYTLTESEIAYERNVGTIKYTMNTAVSQLDNGTPKQQMQNK